MAQGDRLRFPTGDAPGPGMVEDRRGQPPEGNSLTDHLRGITSAARDTIARTINPLDNPFEPGSGLNPFGTERGNIAATSRAAMTRGKSPMPVDLFSRSVRIAETGPPDGDYTTIRGLVRGSARLLGAYGFPSDEWRLLASDAGLAGARWQDRRAQDAVARITFDRLHRKFGDWRWVAAAWKTGEENAGKLQAFPELIDAPEVAQMRAFVENVMRNAQEAILTSGDPLMNEARAAFKTTWEDLAPVRLEAQPGGEAGIGVPRPTVGPSRDYPTDEVEDVLRRRLYAMRERVRNMTPDEESVEPGMGPAATMTAGGSPQPATPGGGTRVPEPGRSRRRLRRNRSEVAGSSGGVQE